MTLATISRDPLNRFDSKTSESLGLASSCLTTMAQFLDRIEGAVDIPHVPIFAGDGWPVEMENITTMDTTPPKNPGLPPVNLTVPKLSGPLNTIDVQRFTPPPFTLGDPGIVIPGAPTVLWPTAPGDAPPVDDIKTPPSPSYTLPRVPTLAEISLPTAPDLDVVQFDGVRPNISLDAPGNLFVYEDQPYSSDVRDAVMEKVLEGIRSGGTGLGAEVEQAIWDRARNRMREDRQQALDEIRAKYAASGCSRPSGPMSAAESRVDREYGRKLSDLDKDILVQQSELAWKSTQQYLDTGLRLEQITVDLHNKVMDRAFGAAKELAQMALAAFDAEVKAHNLQLDQYKTDATVYESRIKADLTKLEKYKALLDAAKLQGQIQAQDVELYTAQLKGVMAVIDIYKGEMEGAKLKSEVQAQKLAAYRSTVEAYAGRVNANVARFNAYSAEVAGQKVKADVYETQVRAWESQVKAVTSQADAEAANAKALADANRSIIEGYQADIQRYKADADLAMKTQENTTSLYRYEVEGFAQKVRAVDTANDVQYKRFTSEIDRFYKLGQTTLAVARQELDRTVEKAKILAETSKAGATVYSQFGASALGMVNASVRLGYDENVSNTAGESTSISASV